MRISDWSSDVCSSDLDQRSALVVAELLDTDPQTGKPLDYVKVGDALEKIRHKYETPGVSVQIIGFAKVVDDMTDAAFQVGGLFVVALLMMGLLLWIYIGSLPLAMLVVATSLVSCTWELGLRSEERRVGHGGVRTG